MKKFLAVLLSGSALLAGCASDYNQALLANDRLRCNSGDQIACEAVPVQEKINHDEAVANGFKVVGAVLLLTAAGVADAAANRNSSVCYNPWNRSYYPC
jgi:hypothetical protein